MRDMMSVWFYQIETIDGRDRVVWRNFSGFPLTIANGYYWSEPAGPEDNIPIPRGPFTSAQEAEDEAMNVDLCIARKEQP